MFTTALVLAMAAVLAPQDKINASQHAALAGDPPYVQQKLKLVDLPKPKGRAQALFNGKDLDEWDAWLGFADPALTYRKPTEKPIGPGGKGSIFKVVKADGQPAILIDGRTWGSLAHKKDIANYHLRLEYKWTGKRYAPRLDLPENNGLLYHSGGSPGAVFGTWMRAVEFEIMKGSTGMVVPVGGDVRVTTQVGHDPAIADPKLRFMVGGRTIEVHVPAWNVENARDFEKPIGQWNRLDLYVVGDRAVHVVNGEPVMVLSDLSVVEPASGKKVPLTSGRIQFQSEGAETLFRNIIIEPIDALPRVEVVRPQTDR